MKTTTTSTVDSRGTEQYNGRSVGQGTVVFRRPSYAEASKFRREVAGMASDLDLTARDMGRMIKLNDEIEQVYFAKIAEFFVRWDWTDFDNEPLPPFNPDETLDLITNDAGVFLIKSIQTLFGLDAGTAERQKK